MLFRRRRKEYLIKQGVEFTLESPAFKNEEMIPVKYTCDGENISPPLVWKDAPEGTKSFVLIVYDPDAPLGTFIHWVLYNIPGTLNSIPEGVPRDEPVVEGVGVQGVNDFGYIGYGGPCPPVGHGVHHYVFALHALSVEPKIKPGARADEVLKEIKDYVIGYATLVGLYERR